MRRFCAAPHPVKRSGRRRASSAPERTLSARAAFYRAGTQRDKRTHCCGGRQLRRAARVQTGDLVDIRFPDRRMESGTVADLDAGSVLVRRDKAGAAIVVARHRLRPAGIGRWRLDV